MSRLRYSKGAGRWPSWCQVSRRRRRYCDAGGGRLICRDCLLRSLVRRSLDTSPVTWRCRDVDALSWSFSLLRLAWPYSRCCFCKALVCALRKLLCRKRSVRLLKRSDGFAQLLLGLSLLARFNFIRLRHCAEVNLAPAEGYRVHQACALSRQWWLCSWCGLQGWGFASLALDEGRYL